MKKCKCPTLFMGKIAIFREKKPVNYQFLGNNCIQKTRFPLKSCADNQENSVQAKDSPLIKTTRNLLSPKDVAPAISPISHRLPVAARDLIFSCNTTTEHYNENCVLLGTNLLHVARFIQLSPLQCSCLLPPLLPQLHCNRLCCSLFCCACHQLRSGVFRSLASALHEPYNENIILKCVLFRFPFHPIRGGARDGPAAIASEWNLMRAHEEHESRSQNGEEFGMHSPRFLNALPPCHTFLFHCSREAHVCVCPCVDVSALGDVHFYWKCVQIMLRKCREM